jgi:hypothetical protein
MMSVIRFLSNRIPVRGNNVSDNQPGNVREEIQLEADLYGNPELRGDAPRSLRIPAFPQISASARIRVPAPVVGVP